MLQILRLTQAFPCVTHLDPTPAPGCRFFCREAHEVRSPRIANVLNRRFPRGTPTQKIQPHRVDAVKEIQALAGNIRARIKHNPRSLRTRWIDLVPINQNSPPQGIDSQRALCSRENPPHLVPESEPLCLTLGDRRMRVAAQENTRHAVLKEEVRAGVVWKPVVLENIRSCNTLNRLHLAGDHAEKINGVDRLHQEESTALLRAGAPNAVPLFKPPPTMVNQLHTPQFPNATRLQHSLHVLRKGGNPHFEVHRKPRRTPFRGVQHAIQFAPVNSHRFLHKHMNPRLKKLTGHVAMKPIRGRNHHSVDAGMLQHLPIVREGGETWMPLASQRQPLRIRVAPSHRLRKLGLIVGKPANVSHTQPLHDQSPRWPDRAESLKKRLSIPHHKAGNAMRLSIMWFITFNALISFYRWIAEASAFQSENHFRPDSPRRASSLLSGVINMLFCVDPLRSRKQDGVLMARSRSEIASDGIETMKLRPSERVREYIIREVDRADLKNGTRLPSNRELARRLEVSVPTVQSVIRSLAKEGRVEARHGSGTYLVTNSPEKTRRIVVAAELQGERMQGDSWMSAVISGLMQATIHGPPTTFSGIAPDKFGRDECVPALLDEIPTADGLIILPYALMPEQRDRIANAYEAQKKPVVNLELPHVTTTANFVSNDYFGPAERLARAWAATGRRRIALVTIGVKYEFSMSTRLRLMGLASGLRDTLGRTTTLDTLNLRADDGDTAYEGVREHLSKCAEPFDAILMPRASSLAGVLRALKEHNLRVPGDVSLATTEMFREPRTTGAGGHPTLVYEPAMSLGGLLIKMLFARIESKAVAVPGFFQSTRIIPGNTTRPRENELLAAGFVN